MPVHSRASSPNTPPEHGFRAWITCDGWLSAAAYDGDPCSSASLPAFGASAMEAESNVRDESASRGWTKSAEGVRWLCPACTAEARGEPAALSTPGSQAGGDRDAPPRYLPDQVHDIPVGDLMPDPHQPRKLFDPDALRTLGESMRAAGQQHPCRFRARLDAEPGTAPLILVDGERRWRAAQLVGLPTVRAVLDTAADSGADLVIRQALLNEPGRPLQPWDWVLTFHHLATRHQLTPAQIAAHLADKRISNNGRPWSRPQVANYLRMLQLPAWAQDLISDGPLTVSHGIYLLPHLGRPDVMSGIREFLETRSAKASAAAGDPEQASEQDPENNPGTSLTAAEARADARITVLELRAQIRSIYARLYVNLDHGSMVANEYLRPRFEWPAGDCQACPKRAEIEGWDGRESYCTDTDCLRALNATCHRPPNGCQAEHDAALDARYNANKVRQADNQARQDRIKTAILGAVDQHSRRDLLALVLWLQIRRDYLLPKDVTTCDLGFVLDLLGDDQEAEFGLRKLATLQIGNLYGEEELARVAGAIGADIAAPPTRAE